MSNVDKTEAEVKAVQFLDALEKSIKKANISPTPWRIEENIDHTWFIYDKNLNMVADKIQNEGDAIFIVNLVNSLV